MLPWGHLAFGYLCYSVWCRISARRPPTGDGALALAFGTQFPDLVDKPLAWTFGLLPSGRSLAHSAFSATLVVVCLYLVVRRRRELVAAFGIGYFSHLLTDSLSALVGGEYGELAFLLYPIMYTDYGVERGFLYRLAQLRVSDFTEPEFLVVVVPVTLLWIADGLPGPRALITLPRRAYERLAGSAVSESEQGG